MKKRSDGRYQTSVVIGYTDGKPIRRYVYGKTKKEAEEKARKVRNLLDYGIALGKDPTIEELGQAWLDAVKKPRVLPQTLYNYQKWLSVLNKHLGGVKVRQLTVRHIEDLQAALLAEGHVATYNHLLQALRSMLNYAIRHDMIARNVTNGIVKLADAPKHEKRAFTPIELRALLNAPLTPEDRCLVDLLLYTGIRIGEALALTTADIDLARQEVNINKTLVPSREEPQGFTKTDAGLRSVPLPDVFVERNSAYISSKAPVEPVFRGRGGRHMTHVTAYRKLQDVAEIAFSGSIPDGFSAHMFRHNYASQLYDSGIMRDDIKAAQYLLGHTDVKTTLDVYTHFQAASIDRERLNRYFTANDVKMMSSRPTQGEKMA